MALCSGGPVPQRSEGRGSQVHQSVSQEKQGLRNQTVCRKIDHKTTDGTATALLCNCLDFELQLEVTPRLLLRPRRRSGRIAKFCAKARLRH
eukprot:3120945-Amphidinium_carterae.1